MNLNLLVLRTHQMEELKLFYSKLGANFEKEQHETGPVHYAATLSDNLVLEIYPTSDGVKTDTGLRLGFAVTHLETTLRTLGSTAAAKQTQWGLRAVVHDPDGRPVELLEAKKTKKQEGQT